MGLSEERLRADVDELARIEPRFGAALQRVGYPPTRIRERGHATLMRTIVGQQVSVKAADAMWRKLTAVVGEPVDLERLGRASDEELRAAGMSRQKSAYLRSLAAEVISGPLDLANLPEDDEAAIAALVQVKGIGRWSAEIYLLFAEGRADIWPAGDLAVQIEVGRILGHESRPSEKLTRELAEPWRPYRGAAAIFAWHHYGADADAMPV
ncbi:DNA-3-methyladenine glycosylase family protein [Sphingomonas mucosissima]|uniref:DNA-3-methyladenine glycosylase II n=1 Tax=Sphingomonas mucosissima TaxID=370959 RepID=A0A245ZSC0_9SPHN|nr:DNA-3-methyladenine glycosylase [Sphingomonas mucosissima]OWK32632.1 DNA-3-methyladenine glycosylase 2 [Sphingomonas mucosissima]